jgi:hypothetical protein
VILKQLNHGQDVEIISELWSGCGDHLRAMVSMFEEGYPNLTEKRLQCHYLLLLTTIVTTAKSALTTILLIVRLST